MNEKLKEILANAEKSTFLEDAHRRKKWRWFKRIWFRIQARYYVNKRKFKNRFSSKRICYGVEIPDWCIGDAVNSFKYKISPEQQKKIRNWYLKNLPDKCEVINDVKSHWIGGNFGTQYYSATSEVWKGFRLCVGENTYVRLY